MGTQGSITVYDEDGKDIANIVTQYDGYDLHEWVERFVSGKQLTNGISNDYDFNGMGDLAARLIAALKNQRYKGDIGQPVKPGNVYLYDTPYETDYHITLVYQGEGKKPKMTVSTPEWTDNYYDNTMLPSLGEANVRMQGAETFDETYRMKGATKSLISDVLRKHGYDDFNELESENLKFLLYDVFIEGMESASYNAETFNADYSLYDRKAKQKVGVKSGYDDYKDAYDDWENEIIKEYPNRVSENEWIVIDTHSAETFNAQNSDMDKKSLVEGEVSIKMNELFEFVNYHVDAEDGAGGDLYDSPGLDEIEEAVSDYFIGYWDFESRHIRNNPRHQNAETFEADAHGDWLTCKDCYADRFIVSGVADDYTPECNACGSRNLAIMSQAEEFDADSTPRFIPVEVIKYDAWFPRRYGREYNPTLFGNDYDDSYAVCVRDIPIAHFDTKEKAENHANTVSTAISVLGGVTPSTIDHPLALREMDGYADKNIRGGMNMAETFDAEEDEWVGGDNGEQIYWSHPSGYQVIQNKIGGLIFIVNEKGGYQGGNYSNIDDAIRNAERMISKGAETFNAYKVAPALSSYSKDELISSKAGPQGSASYDEMVYDPIAQDRLSAESFASDEERRLKAFAKKIENEKKKLVKKAKRSGFYENFGQKEVRKLEDSISDLDYYEQQKYQEMIRDFDNWADSIDLRGLERYAESFASETSSTLKSMGYVAGTIGVGYLIFQRFVKDRLDETMNQ